MRVTIDKLTADTVTHLIKGKVTGLPLDLRVKDHLHHHIAQLLTEKLGVVQINGIHCLVGFLKEVHPDRGVGLHLVPRAAAVRIPQDRNDRSQVVCRILLFFGVCVHRPSPRSQKCNTLHFTQIGGFVKR